MKRFGAKILAMLTAFAMIMPVSVMPVMADEGDSSFTIKAVDDFGNPVEASFEITGEDEQAVWTGTTSDDGTVKVSNVSDGTYTLRETDVDTDTYLLAMVNKYYAEITISGGEVTIAEAEPENYIWTAADNTITVVNRIKVDLSVEKVWDDNDDAEGKRPEEIEITIKADNATISDNSAKLEAIRGWTIEESGPKYTQTTKEEIKYTVTEADVPEGYEATCSGDVEDGFVITNTYVGVDDEDNGNQTTIYEPDISTGESITLAIPDLYGSPYDVDTSFLEALDESIEVSTSDTDYGNTAYTLTFTKAGTFKFEVSYTSKSDDTMYTLSYTVTVEEQTVEEEPEPDDGGDDGDSDDGDDDGSDTGDTDEPDESEPEDGKTKATITVQFLDVDAQKFEITISLTETTADGSVKIHEMLLNADNDWTISFEVDEDSTYSMTVEDIDGYEISLTGSVEDGFTVYIISADEEPEEPEPDDTEPDKSEPDDTEPDESEPDGSEPDESEPTDDGTSDNTGSDTDNSDNTGSGDTSSTTGSTESGDGSSDNISIVTLPDGETIEVNEKTDNVYEDLLLILGGTFEIKVDENAEVEIPDAFEVIERLRNTDGSMTYTLQANEVGEFVIIVTHEDGSKNIYYVTVTDDKDAEGVSEHITINDLESSSSGPGIVEDEDENEDSGSTTGLNLASNNSNGETSTDDSENNSDGTKEDTVETTDNAKTGMAVGFGALAALVVSAISGIAIEKKKRHN